MSRFRASHAPEMLRAACCRADADGPATIQLVLLLLPLALLLTLLPRRLLLQHRRLLLRTVGRGVDSLGPGTSPERLGGGLAIDQLVLWFPACLK